ncbi:TadE/TadG family type IV pilus assembly protein [Pseudemcibacter aquimaris]|uniref:TadE/TadG family type IV pilus assembly protein n=1 Tax=Pseudemcibacter aquimaris TaxID=2857064 RepID=UPI002010F6D3|nr:pilus assembly protein TadG-related protein [Pseudemcibacter aquimaris]MCC3862231.1 Tad domain-containing protein [Pseudemcibacter aquimaris]WDU58983.1 Tad domain-containing protein [Pseudemcibacter aquimaris]
MLKKYLDLLKKCHSHQKGVTAVYLGIMLPIFVGFAGLAFDTSVWFLQKRHNQSTVDAAVMAAALEIRNQLDNNSTATQASLSAIAIADAANNGFTVGGSNSLTVSSPPSAGSYSGQNNYVHAVISSPVEGFFTRALGFSDVMVTASATAGTREIVAGGGGGCIVALDESASGALITIGTTTIDVNCALSSNSTAEDSVILSGNSTLEELVSAINAVGNIKIGGSTDIHVDTDVNTYTSGTDDPFPDLTVPAIPSTCEVNVGNGRGNSLSTLASDYPSFVIEETNDSGDVTGYTFKPGRYCNTGSSNNAIDFGGENITMDTGVYIFDDGLNLSVGSSDNISGTGVSIVLTGDTSSSIGDVNINAGATVNLTPPTVAGVASWSAENAQYAGVTLYVDRNKDWENNANKINGGANVLLDGAVYMPSQDLEWIGNSNNVGGCGMSVSATAKFSGSNGYNLSLTEATCTAYGIWDLINNSGTSVRIALLVE